MSLIFGDNDDDNENYNDENAFDDDDDKDGDDNNGLGWQRTTSLGSCGARGTTWSR